MNCRADAVFTGINGDSRQTSKGLIFWAVAGDRFDGHDFVKEAIEGGAVAAVVAHGKLDKVPKNLPLVVVDDTRVALGKFAARYREDFSPTVIAVAGSNGKTSAKDIIFSVLREQIETVASEASFNNDIGVPQTLLRIEEKHQAAVLEMGTNHPGELAPLIRMAKPRIGVITSIGREHLEFFGDIAGVAEEEGTLAHLLEKDGLLIINGDSPEVNSIIKRARCRVITVGAGQSNDWRVEVISTDENGTRFRLAAPDAAWSGEWVVTLLGRHQAFNAALAILVGRNMELSRAEIQRGLSKCRAAKMRMQIERISGATILNDAYNANADSMRAALQTLAEFPCQGRRIAVIGDMAELGETVAAAHREIGMLAGELKIDHLIAVGNNALWTADAAKAAGAKETSAFEDFSMALTAILNLVQAEDVILVKASRSSRMERVVEAMRKTPAGLSPGTALAA